MSASAQKGIGIPILSVNSLSKSFNNKTVFKDLSFEVKQGMSLAITGKNGSGKSTLLKIICGLLSPNTGQTQLLFSGKVYGSNEIYKFTGFSAPYLNLYDELTGYENLELAAKLRGTGIKNIIKLINRFELSESSKLLCKNYSSGMKQRLKLAFSLLCDPFILLFDEPTTNIDESGILIFKKIIEEHRSKKIIIIATNDKSETGLCENTLNVEEYK